jgi:hypothetical protein
LSGFTTFGRNHCVAFLEFCRLDQFAGQHFSITGVFDDNFAQHLADDDFEVFVVDVLALRTVDLLYLGHQVKLGRVLTHDAQDPVRVDRTLAQTVAGAHHVALVDGDDTYRKYINGWLRRDYAILDWEPPEQEDGP